MPPIRSCEIATVLTNTHKNRGHASNRKKSHGVAAYYFASICLATAGLPLAIASAGTSLTTMLPALHMLLGPIVTPGATNTPAATHDPSRIRIGLITKSNPGRSNRCEPVQKSSLRYAAIRFDDNLIQIQDHHLFTDPNMITDDQSPRKGNPNTTANNNAFTQVSAEQSQPTNTQA